MGVYEEVKQALQDIVAPELKALQVEIRRLDEKIDSLDGKLSARMDSLDKSLNARMDTLDYKIDSLDKSLNGRIDSLKAEITTEIKRLDEKIDIAIQIRERLAAIEGRFEEREKRRSPAKTKK
jgi:predicted  nucleic acid-binding Zn-ribbon protein